MRIRVLLCLIATVALRTAGEAAQSGELDLPELLGLMPAGEATYKSLPLFTYVDFRAAEKAAAARHPKTEEEFKSWPEADRAAWHRAMLRVTAGPEALVSYAHELGNVSPTMAESMGFDFLDVDRAITLWNFPPHALTALSGSSELTKLEDIKEQLRGRGYALNTVDGASVWSRFDDGAFAFDLKDDGAAGDPFDAGQMLSERIAIEPGLLVEASETADLRLALAIRHGRETPDPLVALTVPVFDAILKIPHVDGPVIQAWAVPVLLTGENPAGAPAPKVSRLYPIAVFADVQASGRQMVVIALPFPDRVSAEEGASDVAERLRSWETSLRVTHDKLIKILHGEVESRVVEVVGYGAALRESFSIQAAASAASNPSDQLPLARAAAAEKVDGAIALITISTPKASPTAPADPTDDVPPGALWSVIQKAVLYKDFAPLAVR